MVVQGSGVMSIKPDGTFDTSFGTNGVMYLGLNFWANDILFSAGKFFLAGNQSQQSQQFATLKRFYANGTPDPRFGVLGTTTLRLQAYNAGLARLHLYQDRLVGIGSYTEALVSFFMSRFYLGK